MTDLDDDTVYSYLNALRKLFIIEDAHAWRPNLRAPAFRMIVTAVGDYAYERKEDGVIVCPLSALRP